MFVLQEWQIQELREIFSQERIPKGLRQNLALSDCRDAAHQFAAARIISHAGYIIQEKS